MFSIFIAYAVFYAVRGGVRIPHQLPINISMWNTSLSPRYQNSNAAS